METKKKTAAVIGGGAAGMMAAAALKETAADAIDVVLIERNAYLGAKVLLSGGGRCNLTTGITDVRRLLENYPRGAKFLMSAMYRFPPDKVMDWFETHGVKLKIEDDLRVFPALDDGAEVVGALEKVLNEGGVKIMWNTTVTRVSGKAGGFVLETGGVDDAGAAAVTDCGSAAGSASEIDADFLIITTGGNAHGRTGSKGDGYVFAKELGHKITPLAPSLGALESHEPWIAGLAGVSVKKAGLTLKSYGGEKVYERVGAFIFTHRGVSGPAVFALSSMAAYDKCSSEKPMELGVDFFPDVNMEHLKKRLQKAIEENGKKGIVNLLDMFLPKSLCEVLAREAGLKSGVTAGGLSKDQRAAVLEKMRDFTLRITGRGAGDEFVTAGGVVLDEVNPATMESKICPGLFFAGEVLDVDGFTGGFNLQAAWATGRLAGESIAKTLL